MLKLVNLLEAFTVLKRAVNESLNSYIHYSRIEAGNASVTC